MIRAVKAFSAKLSLYTQQVKNKNVSALPLCLKDVGKSHRCSQRFPGFQVLSRLEQEFARRFRDFEKTCVTFTANPFMDVDISEISVRTDGCTFLS